MNPSLYNNINHQSDIEYLEHLAHRQPDLYDSIKYITENKLIITKPATKYEKALRINSLSSCLRITNCQVLSFFRVKNLQIHTYEIIFDYLQLEAIDFKHHYILYFVADEWKNVNHTVL